ncbi:hypothetical protein Lfu02_69110 [Longispora fulva]|uniref:HTH luxR-type domain-containing protein n=1 Tax=Longispora fulva TaxID=619741 RepID=A0A8J7KIK5_9ACTN|nr:LuxR C-terminal-related transcriptional regulator [Longispora fulva]MBG6134166.1 hypothetical protein [Longispora fulva]GIG62539.1 hypothetical protein Lfu02_69110 [Longispora fulva]
MPRRPRRQRPGIAGVNAETARSVYVTLETVKSHIRNLPAKLEVRDRTQAVVWAYRAGFIDRQPTGASTARITPGVG